MLALLAPLPLQVEVERIVLHAIGSQQTTSTFRTARLSSDLKLELQQLRQVHLGLSWGARSA